MTGHSRTRCARLPCRPSTAPSPRASDDGEIRLWDGRTGRFLRTLAQPGQPGRRAALSARTASGCCRPAATAAASCQHVWDMATRQADRVTYDQARQHRARRRHRAPTASWSPPAAATTAKSTSGTCGPAQTRQVLAGTGAPAGRSASPPTDGASPGAQLAQRHACTRRTARCSSSCACRQPVSASAGPSRSASRCGSDFVPGPRARTAAYTLAHRKGGAYGYDAILDIKRTARRGRPSSAARPTATSIAPTRFTPDGQTIVSGGGNGVLTAYDLEGQAARRVPRPRGRRVGGDAVARRPAARLGQRRPDHPAVELARRAS